MEKEALKEKSTALRFAVMGNGMVFQRWQVDAIRQLKEHGHQMVLLIADDRKTPGSTRFKRLLTRRWSKFLFTFLENRLYKPTAKEPVALDGLQGVDTLRCVVTSRGYSEYFSAADVAAIQNARVDFILRFGFHILRGEILTAARFGIWSFHHDDETKYRGGPAGFWEIYHGDPVSGMILQRLTSRLDAGIILKKGYLKTAMHSYRGNLEQLLSVSSSWPAQVADQVAAHPAIAFPTSDTAAPVYKVPGNLAMSSFILKLLWNKMKFYYSELFEAEDWNIGIIRKPIHEVAFAHAPLKEGDISWLPHLSGNGYLADPSGFIENGKLHIVAEEYYYPVRRAVISEIVCDDPHPVRVVDPVRVGDPVRVMESWFHLSYPYIFEYQNNVYCVPESYQSGNITLYRRDPSSGKFRELRVLVANVEAVDPTLFFHEGCWWLFFTIKKYSTSHLFICYATELTGTFLPHSGNPVKMDVRSSRPAGTPFIHEGLLYRPAQDCSVTYGGRVVINRVLTLTTNEFSEEPVRYVEPVYRSKYGKGLHTLTGINEMTLVDGKRYRFNPGFFLNQLRTKLFKKAEAHV